MVNEGDGPNLLTSVLNSGSATCPLIGSLSPVAHLHDEGYQCRAAHEVWHNVEEATQKILDSVTIGDLAAREMEYDRVGGRYVI